MTVLDLPTQVVTAELPEHHPRVLLATLDRPDRLNAWTIRMEHDLRVVLDHAERSTDVRVVVLTGAGRGFCAGGDTAGLDKMAGTGEYDSGHRDASPSPGYGVAPDFDHPFLYLRGLTVPVIAAINGPAAGVGLCLALCCDVRFAAADAKLTTSFARLGLPAEWASSWLLPRLVGTAVAADLLLSSRVLLGAEAAAVGLVNESIEPPTTVVDHALRYAATMAMGTSPQALGLIKRQLALDLVGSLDQSARRALALTEAAIASSDFREGSAAFRERRAPHFADTPEVSLGEGSAGKSGTVKG